MATRSARDNLRLALWSAGWLAALWFAVQGGEYSTLDLLRQRRQRIRLVRETDSIRVIVDSLAREKRRILTDPKTQERIAREQFGMVRDKELLYRIVGPPDSSNRSP